MTTALGWGVRLGKIDRVYHGTLPYLIPVIQHMGFWPREGGYVHFSATEGLAWSYGVWQASAATALEMDTTLPDPDELIDPYERELARDVQAALDKHGTRMCAVAVVDLTGMRGLENDPAEAGMMLPWENWPRRAPCWRSRFPVSGGRILEWHLHPIPELHDPAVVAQMSGHKRKLLAENPRGHPVLEDLPPVSIPGIPNVRVFTAKVLERHTDLASEWHGLGHSAHVAALALDHPPEDGAHLGVRLAFALLHDALRAHDGIDPGHGARAARLAHGLADAGVLTFDDEEQRLLEAALAQHDRPAAERVKDHPHPDPSLAACWHADFLALERFRRRIDPPGWAAVVFRYCKRHIPNFSREMNEADLVKAGYMKPEAANIVTSSSEESR